MCLNLFETNAHVQGCVTYYEHLFIHEQHKTPALIANHNSKVASTLLFPIPLPNPPNFLRRFKFLSQRGEPVAPTALHDAAREYAWTKTKEILARPT